LVEQYSRPIGAAIYYETRREISPRCSEALQCAVVTGNVIMSHDIAAATELNMRGVYTCETTGVSMRNHTACAGARQSTAPFCGAFFVCTCTQMCSSKTDLWNHICAAKMSRLRQAKHDFQL